MAFQAAQCGPSNIFGKYKHHLFLGCSVVGFTASVGWNEQISEVSVTLVEDPCVADVDHPKIYYDGSCNRQETLAADPGFYVYGAGGNSSPQIGTAVFFRVESGTVGDPNYRAFEFSGLLQSWEEAYKIDGKNSYTVKIVDPRQILEGAQIILNDYSGAVPTDIYNLFNVYGYLEWYGGQYTANEACANTDSGGFGGAQASQAGTPYNFVRNALPILTSKIPIISGDAANYSPYGRLKYRFDYTSGCGIITSDGTYLLDISELPVAPDYFRLTGTNISIMELITQACQESGCDYYIELIPVQDGAIVHKFIKIRVVDRRVVPDYDAIANFLAANVDSVIDSTYGRESRNETTSALLIGGNIQAMWKAASMYENDGFSKTAGTIPTIAPSGVTVGNGVVGPHMAGLCIVDEDSDILQYWGLDDDGNVIKTRKDEDLNQNYIVLNPSIINRLNATLHVPISTDPWGDGRYIRVFNNEFRYATISPDVWLNYAELAFHGIPVTPEIGPNGTGPFGTDLYEALKQAYGYTGKLSTLDMSIFNDLLPPDPDGNRPAANIFNLVKGACQKRFAKYFEEDVETIQKFIADAFSQFYGKKFLVKMPETCVKYDPDDYTKLLYSESPSDGAWPWATVADEEQLLPINGASGVILEALRIEDGRVGPFLTFFGENIDYDKLSEDFLYDNISGYVFAKASVEPDYVFEDFETRTGVYAVISIANEIPTRWNDQDIYLRHAQSYAYWVIQNWEQRIGPPADGYDTTTRYDADGNVIGITETPIYSQQQLDDASSYYSQLFKIFNKFQNMGLDNKLAVTVEPRFPVGAAVPLKSNTYTYGPWYTGGTPGLIRVEKDEGLTPWDYGSIGTMNLAGQAKITAGVTNMTGGETGSITVAGYPTIPLGAEIGAYTGGAGNSLIENRAVTLGSNGYDSFSQFSTTPWTGTFGPNITSISVTIAIAGVTTSYSMRTFTTSFGAFNKYLADRLKTMGPSMRKMQHQTILKGIGKYQRGWKNLGFQGSDRLSLNPFASVYTPKPKGK